jgi:preprotein translocase subunit SecG
MHTVITIIHVLACIFLVLVVLLQTGKGADMGAVFGGSSSTVFGSTGAGNFLTRLTTASAIIFMLTSLSLTYLSSRQTTATVFDSAPVTDSAAPAPQAMPAEPEGQGQPDAQNAPADAPAQQP